MIYHVSDVEDREKVEVSYFQSCRPMHTVACERLNKTH